MAFAVHRQASGRADARHAARRTHDYARNGITSRFAAFNITDATVISELHRRHRAVEFKKFLTTIDRTVPEGMDIHIVADGYGTHKTRRPRPGWPPAWNNDPKPFVWKKTAEEILDSLQRYPRESPAAGTRSSGDRPR